MVSTSDLRWRSFLRRRFYKFAFNYFNGSNEGIIGGETEMRGFMVKFGGKTTRRREYVKFP